MLVNLTHNTFDNHHSTLLCEDNYPKKLPYELGKKLQDHIKCVIELNKHNGKEVLEWKKCINGLISYITDRKVALGYSPHTTHCANSDTICNADLDNKIYYRIKHKFLNSDITTIVFIKDIELNAKNFGLYDPYDDTKEQVNENYSIQNIDAFNMWKNDIRLQINDIISDINDSVFSNMQIYILLCNNNRHGIQHSIRNLTYCNVSNSSDMMFITLSVNYELLYTRLHCVDALQDTHFTKFAITDIIKSAIGHELIKYISKAKQRGSLGEYSCFDQYNENSLITDLYKNKEMSNIAILLDGIK